MAEHARTRAVWLVTGSVTAIFSITGCISLIPPDECSSRVFDKHPRVKWIYGPEHRFEWFGPAGILVREEFTEAGMFGNRIVLECSTQGDMAHPIVEHTYLLDAATGRKVLTISRLWRNPLDWSVRDGRLVVRDLVGVSEAKREYAYDLHTGRRATVPVEAREAASSLEDLPIQIIGRSPHKDWPESGCPNMWSSQLSERVKFVEKANYDTKRYELFLKEITEQGEVDELKLLRLERCSSQLRWAGRTLDGEYVIILRDMVLRVDPPCHLQAN